MRPVLGPARPVPRLCANRAVLRSAGTSGLWRMSLHAYRRSSGHRRPLDPHSMTAGTWAGTRPTRPRVSGIEPISPWNDCLNEGLRDVGCGRENKAPFSQLLPSTSPPCVQRRAHAIQPQHAWAVPCDATAAATADCPLSMRKLILFVGLAFVLAAGTVTVLTIHSQPAVAEFIPSRP
jgi:hypothetical protein